MKTIFHGVLLIVALCFTISSHAADQSAESQAADIAKLFLAYKLVISESQDLINNPALGDKGLTGAVVRKKGRVKYKELTGKDYAVSNDPVTARAQVALERSIDKIVDAAQTHINTQGLGFKGFITASFARQLAGEFSARMHGKASLKFTAPSRVLRNEGNRSDEWEEGVFAKQFAASDWSKTEPYTESTAEGFRWMKPIYHGEGCLSCHGGPKGAKDITGTTMEGAELGDLAGAVSITLK
jgi:hypothetical protein